MEQAAVPAEKAPRGASHRRTAQQHITSHHRRRAPPPVSLMPWAPCLSLIRELSSLSPREGPTAGRVQTRSVAFSFVFLWSSLGGRGHRQRQRSLVTGIFPVQSIHLALSADTKKEARGGERVRSFLSSMTLMFYIPDWIGQKPSGRSRESLVLSGRNLSLM